MSKDIVFDFDLEQLKLGDDVVGNTLNGDEVRGEIVKLDLECSQKMRVQVKANNNILYWLRTVEYATK